MTTKEVFVSRFKELADEYPNRTEFAKSLNMSQQTVSYWLNGSRVPDASNLAIISRKTGITVDYLLGLSDVKRPDVELQAVSKYTGLTDKALEVLHEMKPDERHIIQLLLEKNRGKVVIMSMNNYFKNQMKAHDFILHDATNGQKMLLYGTDVENAQLETIKGFVKELKEEVLKNGNT